MSSKKYFTGDYERYYQEFSGTDVNASAANFSSEIEILSKEFENVKNVVTNWSSEGATYLNNSVVQNVLSRFGVIEQNIANSFLPATEAVEKLKLDLELMKETDEQLIDIELQLESERARNVPEKISDGKDESGKTKYKTNPDYAPWQNNIRNLEAQLAETTLFLEEITKRCDEYIKLIVQLENSIVEFSDCLDIAKAVLFENDENFNMTMEERMKALEEYLKSYDTMIREIDLFYKKNYGTGLVFNRQDFQKVFMLFDAFDLFELAGVEKRDFENLSASGKDNILLRIDSLTKVMAYCNDRGANNETTVLDKIQEYLSGKSWEESGLAKIYEEADTWLKNEFDENDFFNRMKKNYNIDNPKEYLKNNMEDIFSAYERLNAKHLEERGVYQTKLMLEQQKRNLKEGMRLMPFEMNYNNEDFINEYLGKYDGEIEGLDKIYNEQLTSHERALYMYILDKNGPEEAKEYLLAMENTVNMREGQERAVEYVNRVCGDGYQVWDLATTSGTGLIDGLRNFWNGIGDLGRVASTQEGTLAVIDYEMQFKSQYMLEYAKDVGLEMNPEDYNSAWAKLLNQGYQTGNTVGNMVTPMVVSCIPGVGQALSTVLMTASFSGNAAVEGRQQGLSVGEAYIYGGISGISEVAMERVLGRVPYIGQLSGKGGFIGDVVGEMFEEGVQTFVDAGVGYAFFEDQRDDFSWSQTFANAGEAMKQAMISTPFMNLTGKGIGKVSGITTNIAVNTFTGGKFNEVGTYLGRYSTEEAQTFLADKVAEKQASFFMGKVDAGLKSAIDAVETNATVNLIDKAYLNRAIACASPQELAAVTSKISETSETGMAQLKNSGLLTENSLRRLNIADTFKSIDSQTSGELNVSNLNANDLGTTVTRDGRTLSEYIADTKVSLITENTRTELNNISSKQALAVENRIEDNIKAHENYIRQKERTENLKTLFTNPVEGVKKITTQTINDMSTTATNVVQDVKDTVRHTVSQTQNVINTIKDTTAKTVNVMSTTAHNTAESIKSATSTTRTNISNATHNVMNGIGNVAQTATNKLGNLFASAETMSPIIAFGGISAVGASSIYGGNIASAAVNGQINPNVQNNSIKTDSLTASQTKIEGATDSLYSTSGNANNSSNRNTNNILSKNNFDQANSVPRAGTFMDNNTLSPNATDGAQKANLDLTRAQEIAKELGVEYASVLDGSVIVDENLRKKWISLKETTRENSDITVSNSSKVTPIIEETLTGKENLLNDSLTEQNAEEAFSLMLENMINCHKKGEIYKLTLYDKVLLTIENKDILDQNNIIMTLINQGKCTFEEMSEIASNINDESINFTNEEIEFILNNHEKNELFLNALRATGQFYETITSYEAETLTNDDIIELIREGKLNESLLTINAYKNLLSKGLSETIKRNSCNNYGEKNNPTCSDKSNMPDFKLTQKIIEESTKNPSLVKLLIDENVYIVELLDCFKLKITENGKIQTLLEYAIENGKIENLFKSVSLENITQAAKNNPQLAKYLIDSGKYTSSIGSCINMTIEEDGKTQTLAEYAIENRKTESLFANVPLEVITQKAKDNPQLAKCLIDNGKYTSSIGSCINMTIEENGKTQTLAEYAIERGKIENIIEIVSLENITQLAKDNPQLAKYLIDNGKYTSNIGSCINMTIEENGKTQTLAEYAIERGKIENIIEIVSLENITQLAKDNPQLAKYLIDNGKYTSSIGSCINMTIEEDGKTQTLAEYAVERGKIENIIEIVSLENITQLAKDNPQLAKYLIDSGKYNNSIIDWINLTIEEDGKKKTLLEYIVECKYFNQIVDVFDIASKSTKIYPEVFKIANMDIGNDGKYISVLEFLDINNKINDKAILNILTQNLYFPQEITLINTGIVISEGIVNIESDIKYNGNTVKVYDYLQEKLNIEEMILDEERFNELSILGITEEKLAKMNSVFPKITQIAIQEVDSNNSSELIHEEVVQVREQILKKIFSMPKHSYITCVLECINENNNININDINDIVEVSTIIKNSNSQEISKIDVALLKNLLLTNTAKETIKKRYEEIERIFIKNNLPFVGKVYKVFEKLYPNFTGFGFESNASIDNLDMMSPVLKQDVAKTHSSLYRKFVIFSDLIKASLGSNNRSMNDYLKNLEIGVTLYNDICDGKISYEQLSKEQKKELTTFRNHLITMYENTLLRDITKNDFVTSKNLIDDITELAKKITLDDSIPSKLADRLVSMFMGMSGIKTLEEAKVYISSKIENAEKRNIERAKKPIKLEKGDIIKGLGKIDYLRNILQNGSVAREFLGESSGSDATPLDTDLVLIRNPDIIIEELDEHYGPIYIALKNDERFITTRTNEGQIVNKFNINDVTSKYELFYTGQISDTHYGIRTGFASSEIDCFILKEYDNRVALEIALNGFYIPIIDVNGNVIFTYDDYLSIREKMNGLPYFGETQYKLSPNLITAAIEEMIPKLETNNQEVEAKRNKIKDAVQDVLNEFGLEMSEDLEGDLTEGTVEFIDTGSTGRGTNKPGDGDFDFMMKIDRGIYFDSEKFGLIKSKLEERFKKYGEIGVPEIVNGNFRFKGVQIDSKTLVDIDITFEIKTDKVPYSTDKCVRERLKTIKEQTPKMYDYVVANILHAKSVLKDAHVYKAFRSDPEQGGLGGVGVENWILQNGGSFIDAARSFLKASTDKNGNTLSFEEFKNNYAIWDFGNNHLAMKKEIYPHDNFIENMSKHGYQKMVEILKKYMETYDRN